MEFDLVSYTAKAIRIRANNPSFYGLPKIHKTDIPLTPVVDYINSPTYNLSRYLAKILKPYESVIKYGIKHSNDFKKLSVISA